RFWLNSARSKLTSRDLESPDGVRPDKLNRPERFLIVVAPPFSLAFGRPDCKPVRVRDDHYHLRAICALLEDIAGLKRRIERFWPVDNDAASFRRRFRNRFFSSNG